MFSSISYYLIISISPNIFLCKSVLFVGPCVYDKEDKKLCVCFHNGVPNNTGKLCRFFTLHMVRFRHRHTNEYQKTALQSPEDA